MKIVIIAGPYGDASGFLNIESNIARARETAAWLVEHGYGYYCPHLNSAHFECITRDVPVAFWYAMDHTILERAGDALLVIGHSKGVSGDIEKAHARGIPVFMEREALLAGLKP